MVALSDLASGNYVIFRRVLAGAFVATVPLLLLLVAVLTIVALDVKTGEIVYGPERLPSGTYSASPILADGKIYVGGLDFSRSSDNDGRAADWFFEQTEFVIRNGTVRWTDEMRTKSAALRPPGSRGRLQRGSAMLSWSCGCSR